MAHSSGIKPSQELLEAFISSDPTIRCIKASIVDESIVVSATLSKSSTAEIDFDLLKYISDSEDPAFFLYKLDTSNNWLLVQYSPDHAKVKSKMIYASSKSSLTKELGDSNFVDLYFATNQEDLTTQGYLKHLDHKNSENPLTHREQELAAIKIAEGQIDHSISSKRALTSSLSFPMTPNANEAIQSFISGKFNLCSFVISNSQEIDLESNHNIDSIKSIYEILTDNEPKFILLKLNDQVTFAYVCPPKAPIKQKMVYSSSKSSFVGQISDRLLFNCKLEVDGFIELEQEFESANVKPEPYKFSKPMRPGKR